MSLGTFYIAPCLDDSPRALGFIDLKKHFKNTSAGRLSPAIHKFISLNQDVLAFLDVSAVCEGYDPFAELQFTTGKYIGAVPLRSPVNGKQIGDFVVRPRFSDDKFLFEQLTKILLMLKVSIEPEYLDTMPLASGEMVRPPRYYDALKFVTAYADAIKVNWHKFRTIDHSHPYPKTSTNWLRYIENENDVNKKLVFPSRDNELSPQHPEWRQAKMVFEIAKEELQRPTTPMTIRFQSRELIQSISIKSNHILPMPIKQFTLHAYEPKAIKAMKNQANVFLNAHSKEVSAWRIDIADLFEKYVQHTVQTIVREMPARLYKNPRFTVRGYLPSWGLKHLEPDALIETDRISVAIDAKYKVHYYSRNQTSTILKETHRADLHQILSYCSFSTAKYKAGMLFYPSNKYSSQSFYYTNPYNGTQTEVVIVGLPFEAEIKNETIQGLTSLFSNVINPMHAVSY